MQPSCRGNGRSLALINRHAEAVQHTARVQIGLDIHRAVIEVAESDAVTILEQEDRQIGDLRAYAVDLAEGCLHLSRGPASPDAQRITMEPVRNQLAQLSQRAWCVVHVTRSSRQPSEHTFQLRKGHLRDPRGVQMAQRSAKV